MYASRQSNVFYSILLRCATSFLFFVLRISLPINHFRRVNWILMNLCMDTWTCRESSQVTRVLLTHWLTFLLDSTRLNILWGRTLASKGKRTAKKALPLRSNPEYITAVKWCEHDDDADFRVLSLLLSLSSIIIFKPTHLLLFLKRNRFFSPEKYLR